MKTVLKKNPLYESFDFENEDINIESEIPIYRYKKFLENTYDISGSTKFHEVGGKFIIDVNGSVWVKNRAITSLVEGNLEFGSVSGDFFCTNCKNLISLKGSPKIVKGGFYCWDCNSLKTLEGAPRRVKEFSCSYCPSLKTLEGGPKFVAGIYACMGCDSLTTLKGAPDFVGSDFTCKGCKNLISFEGMPKEIKGKFRSGKLKKIKLTESFDFNSEEDEDFDNIIESHRYKKFLEENYEITGELKPYKKDGKLFIDVEGNVSVKNLYIKSLTNGNFHFGELIGDFNCSCCLNLENFKGGPIKVGGNFECEMCPNIYSLEGAPKEVCGYFNCWGCKNLSSYDGCPEYIGGKFIIYGTSLKRSILESFDFNSDETEDFDKTISSSKWFALIKKAVQESVEISIENVPGKIFPYAMRENTKNLSKVITPLRNLIKAVDSSNDIKLDFQLDHQAAQISCDIIEGTNKSNIYIASSYPAAPMYIGEFIHKIYLMILLKFNLIRNLSEFRSMIKEETKILYSL